MDILYAYLGKYWRLVALALVLAATNQIFSLLDPLIFRHVIDSYATKYSQYTTGFTTRCGASRWERGELSLLWG